jgi:hypothetical protein
MPFYFHPQTKASATVAIPNSFLSITVDSTDRALEDFGAIDASIVNSATLFYIQVGSAGDIKMTYDGITNPSTANGVVIPSGTTVFTVEGNENIKNIKLVRDTVDVTCLVWFERLV